MVNLRFDSMGAKQFGDLTAAHVGERLAILLDGKVYQRARAARARIYGGNARISGNFTDRARAALSSALENPLATPVQDRAGAQRLGDAGRAIPSGAA